MLFNSVNFVAFALVIAVAYPFMLRRVTLRNAFLLLASYFFYGCWGARFLLLLLFSTLVDYGVALAMGSAKSTWHPRGLLLLSVISNLAVLGYFKYANFFIESASHVLGQLGMHASYPTLQIVLPVGISFYTFQTLSYTIDVYRRQLGPTKNLLAFALYVSFFPQLVAGPIERATRLLPQLAAPVTYHKRDFSIGSWLILFGYFKKVFVADNIGASIDPIFNDPGNYSAFETWLAVFGFSVQIYGDFSGYSDIARGIARLLGFQLMVNFRLPYFAAGPSEFWNRWHISLSSWLRDYLYIPLGGNRKGVFRTFCNLFITMLLGGLWHGASMSFVAWGGFHGLLLVGERCLALGKRRVRKAGRHVAIRVMLMFLLTQMGWLIFRAPNLDLAWIMVTNQDWYWAGSTNRLLLKLLCYAGPLVMMDAWMELTGDLLIVLKQNLFVQCCFTVVLLFTIVALGFDGRSEFIYFQF